MYDPVKQSRRPYEAAGMAIAPPPPIPPPTPAATLQPPPNEFGEPAEMELKREMLGMVQNQAQAPAVAGAPVTQASALPAQPALTPNTPPPQTGRTEDVQPRVPPPHTWTTPQLLPRIERSELPTAPPSAGQGLQGQSYNGRDFSGVNVDGVAIGSPEFNAMTPAQQRQIVLTGEARRRQTAADSRWADVWGGEGGAGRQRYNAEILNRADNPAYTGPDGVQGPYGMRQSYENWAGDSGRPGAESAYRQNWFQQNGYGPDGDPSDPALTDAAMLDSTYGGVDQQYGTGDGSRGYIRTEADPYGEDAAEQQRIQDELRAGIGNGQGTGGTHEVDFSGGTLDPYRGDDSVFAPPVTDGTGGVPPQPGDDDEATDDELRALIRDRANRESDFDTGFMDPSQMFEQGADALEARLERGRTDSTRRIREVMASRGVNEGSPEYGELANLEGELGVQRQEGLSQLNRERYGFSLDARAQELQKYGIDTSLSYQYASLEQDAGFRGRALDLQKSGMDMDEAYRYAAMAQDAGFRQQVLDLQRDGMSLDDAYRKAALAQDKEQYGSQADIQKAGLDLERQRMVSQIQSMLYDNEIEWKDVPTWIRDILVPDWRSSRP